MPDPQGEIQPSQQQVRDVAGAAPNAIQQYYLYRPRDVAGGAPWPILLFLHGRGEARLDRQQPNQGINAVMNYGTPPQLCTNATWNPPFIIVSPQLPAYTSRWHEAGHLREVGLILNNVIQWYQGDPS